MSNPRFIYWQNEDMWLGHNEEYTNYMTQGASFEDLQEHLIDLGSELRHGKIPHARRAAGLPIT